MPDRPAGERASSALVSLVALSLAGGYFLEVAHVHQHAARIGADVAGVVLLTYAVCGIGYLVVRDTPRPTE